MYNDDNLSSLYDSCASTGLGCSATLTFFHQCRLHSASSSPPENSIRPFAIVRSFSDRQYSFGRCCGIGGQVRPYRMLSSRVLALLKRYRNFLGGALISRHPFAGDVLDLAMLSFMWPAAMHAFAQSVSGKFLQVLSSWERRLIS